MEEEKVFGNFSAMLSINVMKAKVWQNFYLGLRPDPAHLNTTQYQKPSNVTFKMGREHV